jgi:hypothetical protein
MRASLGTLLFLVFLFLLLSFGSDMKVGLSVASSTSSTVSFTGDALTFEPGLDDRELFHFINIVHAIVLLFTPLIIIR